MFGRAASKQQGAAKEYAVVPGKVNEDLQRERQKCSFDNLELTHYLDGGVEKYKDRKERGQNLTFNLEHSANLFLLIEINLHKYAKLLLIIMIFV
jgi:hypothetical protein